MSVNKAKPQTSTSSAQTSKPISLQDVRGVTIVGNEAPVSILDGGAIGQAFDFGGRAFDFGDASLGFAGGALEQAASLTLQLIEGQAKAGADALEAIKGSADKGFAFAMNAGRSDIATIQGIGKGLVVIVGIVAAAYVVRGWNK